LIELEGHNSCDADREEEGVGASIVAGGDAPPVFEPREAILDLVALAMERFVIVKGRFSVFGGRDAARRPRAASAARNQSLS
jgi:hypothetical protein